MQSDRHTTSQSSRVFHAGVGIRPLSIFAVENHLARCRKDQKLPADFVLHSLRHACGTCLGESGADAFTIMRVIGQCKVTVSQRYVHLTLEFFERAFKRLELMSKWETLPSLWRQPGRSLREVRQSDRRGQWFN